MKIELPSSQWWAQEITDTGLSVQRKNLTSIEIKLSPKSTHCPFSDWKLLNKQRDKQLTFFNTYEKNIWISESMLIIDFRNIDKTTFNIYFIKFNVRRDFFFLNVYSILILNKSMRTTYFKYFYQFWIIIYTYYLYWCWKSILWWTSIVKSIFVFAKHRYNFHFRCPHRY